MDTGVLSCFPKKIRDYMFVNREVDCIIIQTLPFSMTIYTPRDINIAPEMIPTSNSAGTAALTDTFRIECIQNSLTVHCYISTYNLCIL